MCINLCFYITTYSNKRISAAGSRSGYVKIGNRKINHQKRCRRAPRPLQKDAPGKMLPVSWFNVHMR